MISVGNASDHGWRADLTPDWIDEPYPDDIAELLTELDDIQESADDEDNTDVEYLRTVPIKETLTTFKRKRLVLEA